MATRWDYELASIRRVGFDTNALIYFIRSVAPYASLIADAVAMIVQGGALGVLSTVVEVELLVRPLRDRDGDSLDKVEFLLQRTPNFLIRPVDRAVARRAADVRARTGLSVPDAIIVATALEERCDAIIGNDARIASRITGIPYLLLDDYIP